MYIILKSMVLYLDMLYYLICIEDTENLYNKNI